MKLLSIFKVSLLLVLSSVQTLYAWDEDGHVIVTKLAHTKLPPSMPEWVRSPEVQWRLAYLCAEPDRWRGQKSLDLDHINNPDHYLDVEDLFAYGLSLKTLPPLRREFTDLLATAKCKNPSLDKRNPEKDKAYVYDVPGLLPWSIAELHWKIASGWTTLKTYEKYPNRVSPIEVQTAKDIIIYNMGILSHFVGDGSQPLHLTQHHHGWVGANPKGYTTDRHFHALIDGGIIDLNHITFESLAGRAKAPRSVSPGALWAQINDYLGESFSEVTPLYELEKSGQLKQARGREFIEERLLTGGSMLAGVWISAYQAAVIDDFRANRLTSRPAVEATTQPAIQR
jgi:hypothetical protein